jgi:hypothetical protein
MYIDHICTHEIENYINKKFLYHVTYNVTIFIETLLINDIANILRPCMIYIFINIFIFISAKIKKFDLTLSFK